MAALVRKYGLFYLTHAGTFFLLCAYSLAASAPNYPFLPAMFFPIYLSSTVALSERETGDPLLGILPVTPGEIMKVKFGLTFVFVLIGWLHMAFFTALQDLDPRIVSNVLKLNTISSIYTLALAVVFQLGLHFFGQSVFHKVIVIFTVVTAVFSIVFFIGLAERGNNHIGRFPLNPALEALPGFLVGVAAVGAGILFYLMLKSGPWNPRSWSTD